MPNIRIKDIPTTAPATVSGDFFAVDSNASTRKLDAFAPTFGGGIVVAGGAFAAASFYKASSLGSVLSGATGTSYDFFLTNPAGSYIMQVPTGTRNVEFAATLTTIGNATIGGAANIGGQLKVTNATIPDLWLQNTTGANSAYRNVLFRQNSNGTFKLLTTSDAGVLTLDNILVGDNATGTLLFGKSLNSNNGRLQLAESTAIGGGIGFHSDTALYRSAAGQMALDATTNVPALTFRQSGANAMYLYTSSLNGFIGTTGANSLSLQTQGANALVLDSSQNATFAKDILLGTSGPSVPSTLSGHAPRQGLVFDGTSNATMTLGSAIGTGNFTVLVWVNPNATSGVQLLIGDSSGNGSMSLNGASLRWFDLTGGSKTFTSTVTAGKMSMVAIVRSGTTLTSYANAIAGDTHTSAHNLSGTAWVVGGYGGGDRTTGIVGGPTIYNRALTQDELRKLYENGAPAAADINSASNTSLITGAASDFSSDTGYWTKTGTASIGSGVCSLPAVSSILRAGLTTPGKRYRLTVTLSGGTLYVTNADLVTYGSISGAGTGSLEFVVGSLGAIQLVNHVGTITIDNVTLIPIGAVLAPDATQTGGGLTWYDISGNSANITLPASGVAWNVPFSGNVTSAGQLNLRASGTNRDIILTPTGSGVTESTNKIRATGTGSPTTGGNGVEIEMLSSVGRVFAYDRTGGVSLPLSLQSPGGNVLIGTTVNSSALLQVGTNTTTAAGGMIFGTDTRLYRSAVNTLSFDTTGNAAVINVRESGTITAAIGTVTGDLYLQTQQASKKVYIKTANAATAVTFDENQNSIFAGNVAVGGSVNSDGVNGNALFGGVKRVIVGYDTSADIGNIAAVHTGTGWKALALQPVSGAVLIGKTTDTGNGRLQFLESTSAQNGIQFGTDVSLYRSAANTLTLGSNATVTGTLTVNGTSATVGSGTGSIVSKLNGAAGSYKLSIYQSAGVDRWYAGVAAGAEGGSNGGAPYSIVALTDAGAVIDNALLITRAAGGSITTPRPVAISSTTASTTTSTGALVVGNGTSGGLGVGGSINAGAVHATHNFTGGDGGSGSTIVNFKDNSGSNKIVIGGSGRLACYAGIPSTDQSNGSLVVVGGVGVSGNVNVEGAISALANTNGGILQLNLVNSSTGNAASSLFRFNAGTRTASLQAYNDTHATLAGQLRVGTSNGDIVLVPSGVASATFGASAATLTGNLISTAAGGKFLIFGTGNTTESKELTFKRSDNADNFTLGLTGSAYAGSLTGLGNNEAFLYNSNASAFRIFIGTLATNRFDFTQSQFKINATTASTTTSSGALVVSGGVGIGGETYIGGVLECISGSGIRIRTASTVAPKLSLIQTSWVTWEIQNKASSNNFFLTSNGSTDALTLTTGGNATLGGSITTSAPSGGTAAAWKLGTVATVSPTSPNRTIEVDIGGTIYYIAAKTTNN